MSSRCYSRQEAKLNHDEKQILSFFCYLRLYDTHTHTHSPHIISRLSETKKKNCPMCVSSNSFSKLGLFKKFYENNKL